MHPVSRALPRHAIVPSPPPLYGREPWENNAAKLAAAWVRRDALCQHGRKQAAIQKYGQLELDGQHARHDAIRPKRLPGHRLVPYQLCTALHYSRCVLSDGFASAPPVQSRRVWMTSCAAAAHSDLSEVASGRDAAAQFTLDELRGLADKFPCPGGG
ncbi:hypothetical protein EJ04DRAFT_550319 [Polyplosphaeria fusca]|uniref:Uncharacterized protein n=1 Tax=Polyplosphaeria fusca TaxID=682080 RepID=A0A9P4R6C8_9PLEO|nr:hypothetical protein EJ04DRAFT_550319 [Polyplosphaeria fusca]